MSPNRIESEGSVPAGHIPGIGPVQGEAGIGPAWAIPGKRDTIGESDRSRMPSGTPLPAPNADQPTLPPVDQEKVNLGYQKTAECLQSNRYLNGSFLAKFFAKMLELLRQESTIHLNEAEAELLVRDMLKQLARESGALAKALTQKQAREQLVQAVMAFVNAGVSAMSFAEYGRNLGAAKREVSTEIETQREVVQQAEREAGQDPSATDQLAHIRDEDPPKVKAAKEKLKSMEANSDYVTHQRVTRKDEQTRTLSQIFTQVVNGIQGVLVASIKNEASLQEEAQKLTEGFMQAMNKYSESSSKQRDNAAAAFDKFFDSLLRVIQQTNQALSMGSH